MKESINQLLKSLDESKNQVLDLESKIKEEYFSIFDKLEVVKKIVISCENSNDHGYPENDEFINLFVRIDSFELNMEGLEKKYFFEYLEDNYNIFTDSSSDSFVYSTGPNIIINHYGDVLDEDSGKWVISKNDYSSTNERNQLIEAYMENSGCFPGVFEVDRYGHVTPVNTKKTA